MSIAKRLVTLLYFIQLAQSQSDSQLGSPISPRSRSFHSAVAIGSKMVIYGGIIGSEPTDPLKATATNELIVFDTVTKKWYQPKMKSQPSAMKLHTATSLPGDLRMFVYGSNSNDTAITYLDTSQWSWSTFSSSAQSTHQKGMMGATIDGVKYKNLGGNQDKQSLIVFGGETQESNSDLNSMFDFYSADSKTWENQSSGQASSFHSSCTIPEYNLLITFGGLGQSNTVTNQVYHLVYNAPQFYPNNPVEGTRPEARKAATLTCIGTKAILLGGAKGNWESFEFDGFELKIEFNSAGNSVVKSTWNPIVFKNPGDRPDPRIGHSAVVIDDKIYVYGGMSNGIKSDVSTVYILDTKTYTWSKVTSTSSGSSSSDSSDPSDSQSNTKTSTTVIIISVLVAIFGIIAIAVCLIFGLRRWRKKKGQDRQIIPNDYSSPTDEEPKRMSSIPPGFPPSATSSGLPLTYLNPSSTLSPSHYRSSGATSVDSDLSNHNVLESPSPSLPSTLAINPISPVNHNVQMMSRSTNLHQNLRAIPTHVDHNPIQADYFSPLEQIARLQHDISSISTPETPRWPIENNTDIFEQSVTGHRSFRDNLSSTLDSDHIVHETFSYPMSETTLLSHRRSVVIPSPLLSPNSPLYNLLTKKYTIMNYSLPMDREFGFHQPLAVSGINPATLLPVTIWIYNSPIPFENDLEIIKSLEGPYVLNLIDQFTLKPTHNSTYYILVQERSHVTLAEALVSLTQPLSDIEVRSICQQIVECVHDCHSKGYIIGDLKPNRFSFVCNENQPIRLVLNRIEGCVPFDTELDRPSLPRHCSPELARTYPLSSSEIALAHPSMDMWALGCLLYELYTCQPLFDPTLSPDQLIEFLSQPESPLFTLSNGVKWAQGGEGLRWPPNASVNSEAHEILECLLASQPESRLSALDLLRTQFLQSLDHVDYDSAQGSLNVLGSPALPLQAFECKFGPTLRKNVLLLRQQLTSTCEVYVPRLPVITLGPNAGDNWEDPNQWNSDTFVLHFLCEHDELIHFTQHSGFPILHPKKFFRRSGVLLSITSKLISLYLVPEMYDLYNITLPPMQSILRHYPTEPHIFFDRMANCLTEFCRSDCIPELRSSAEELAHLPKDFEPLSSKPWTLWVNLARRIVSISRYQGLKSIQELLGLDWNHQCKEIGHLLYSTTRPTSILDVGDAVGTRWRGWECEVHSNNQN